MLAALAPHSLRKRRDRQAGRVPLDHDARDPFGTRARIGLADDHEMRGNVGIRDQPFASIEHIVVAVADRMRADVQPGTEIGFRQTERDRLRTVRNTGHDVLELLL